jgi:hypothetical protein
MPASSIDTFLACSIMIALVLSAMIGTSMTLHPFLSGLSYKNYVERHEQLTKYLLLTTGTPSDWGCMSEVVPNSFGLASVNSFHPYELDIDKITRLNNENAYSITYHQLLESFGTRDVALRIEIKTLFDLSVNLASTSEKENETTYNFEFFTDKSEFPISAQLRCYVIVKDYVHKVTLSTSSSGNGSANITIPISKNGTALLVAFAKTKPQITAFNVYSFSHNSSTPKPNGTFMRLNPVNYVLNTFFSYPNEEVLRAQVFTYNYCFNLTQISGGNQTAEYNIPHLLDASPMILVLTGFNGTSSFAEWVSYPQLPLEIGANLSESSVVSFTYIVTINLAFYDLTIKCGGVTFDYIQQQRTD